MILVTGATGHVGSEPVRLLAASGTPARALIHSPEKEAPIKQLGLETVLGDFEKPDTLDAAMAGCDRVFLLSPPNPGQPEQEQNVIDAAKRAGVAHVVKQSVPGAEPGASWCLAAGTPRSSSTWPNRAWRTPCCGPTTSCRTSSCRHSPCPIRECSTV